MRGRLYAVAGTVFGFFLIVSLASGQELIPVHREAINVGGSIVAVDVYFSGENMLETKVIGFMERARPRLKSVLILGPGAGRLGPVTRDTVLAGLETDPPFPTRNQGLLDMNAGSDVVASGTLTRERIQHLLPIEEMREEIEKRRKRGKETHYEYWVYMESSQRGGNVLRYKFDLDKLPELLLAGSDS